MELILNNVEKKYGNNPAVSECSVVLREGVYGLLGPNGSGKTTLIRMICSLIKPSSGEITLNGTSIFQLDEEYRDILGYLPQHFGYYPNFTAHDFLIYISSLKGIPRKIAEENIADLLQLTGLYEERNKKIKTYSGGMKQRALLAQALIGNPSVIILDEPTAGLDPNERIRFRNIISKIASNRIVIIATHVVSDIQFIANRVLILNKGRIAAEGTPCELCDSIRGKVFEINTDMEDLEELERKFKIGDMVNNEKNIRIRVVGDMVPDRYDYIEVMPNLEDAYLYLVG